METKTKKQTSRSQATGHNDWRNLVQGFVNGMLEHLSENVTQKVHAWTKQFKRRAIGSVVMVFGFTYFLTGLATYADEIMAKSAPGAGYMIVGLLALLIGYSVSRK